MEIFVIDGFVGIVGHQVESQDDVGFAEPLHEQASITHVAFLPEVREQLLHGRFVAQGEHRDHRAFVGAGERQCGAEDGANFLEVLRDFLGLIFTRIAHHDEVRAADFHPAARGFVLSPGVGSRGGRRQSEHEQQERGRQTEKSASRIHPNVV